MRKNISRISHAVLAGAAMLLAPLAFGADAPAARPNILLVISDDIGVDAATDMYPGLIDGLMKQYGPEGHNQPDYKQIEGRPASTPTLAALSKQGMRFTQAWVQPFCANTRASLLTGLYPVHTGVLDYTGSLSQHHHSFVRDLKEKGGYSTAIIGKWHVAGLVPANAVVEKPYPGMKPKEAGFDYFAGNMNGALSTYFEYEHQIQDDATPADKWRTESAPTRSLPGIRATTYAPVVKVADTIDWISRQESANPDKPWFVWLAFNLSHISEKQQPNPMAVPDVDTLDEPSRKEMEACGGTFGSANVGRCTDKELMRAMTNSLDTVLGKLLAKVDALDPNTYVIFVGDNGTWMFGANREFIDNMYITRQNRGKGTSFESGARVEMAIRGPGIPAGSKSDAPVNGVDFFATILELARLPVPKTVPDHHGTMVPLDGVSLTPVLFNGAASVRDPDRGFQLAETINPLKQNARQVGARNGRYKLVCDRDAETGSCIFLDLQRDPLEEYPLSKPVSCTDYQAGRLTPAKQDWHFCRLQEVIARESFLAR